MQHLGHPSACWVIWPPKLSTRLTPSDIHDPQEVMARARALSLELGTQITPRFEALAFKA
jgi:hypothetical protein